MRCYAEEALAQGNEKSQMQNSVGGELVELHPVDEQKSPKEFVSGQGEAALKECEEDARKTMVHPGGGAGNTSAPGLRTFFLSFGMHPSLRNLLRSLSEMLELSQSPDFFFIGPSPPSVAGPFFFA